MKKMIMMLACALSLLTTATKAEPVFPVRVQDGQTIWSVYGDDYQIINQSTSSSSATSGLIACFLMMDWQGNQSIVLNYINKNGQKVWLEMRKLGSNPKMVFLHSCLA